MQDTLYIIGNGFDLFHGLKTSYANFRNYAERKRALWTPLEKLYGEKLNENLWWSEFEVNLGKVDYDNLLNTNNGAALGLFITKDFFVYHLPFFFGDWIKRVNDTIIKDCNDKRVDVDKNALFFSFNYTTTLEQIYGVKGVNICHIHKCVTNLQLNERCLIVGHDSSLGQLMQKASYNNTSSFPQFADDINREVEKGAKKVRERIIDFSNEFSKYSEIKHYIIMGFSLNDIDKPYIEKIIEDNKNIDAADWIFYYHKEEEKKLFKEKLLNLGIKENNIKESIYW